MAARFFSHALKSLVHEPKFVVAKFTVANAAAGTVTLANFPYNVGINSVNHTGTGVYKVVLQDRYAAISDFKVTSLSGSNLAYFVTNDQSNTNNKFIEFAAKISDGTNTNIANTLVSVVRIEFLDAIARS